MTQLTPNAILVDVPEGVSLSTVKNYISTHPFIEGFNGNMWRILSLLSEMTEEKWVDLVHEYYSSEKEIPWTYENYLDKNNPFDTATESGLSLLSSLGITDTKNKLVLVK